MRSKMKRGEDLRRSLERLDLPDSALTGWDLLEHLTEEHGADMFDVLYGRRLAPAVRARHHTWGALWGAGLSLGAMAGSFGADPETVVHGVRSMAARLGLR